MDLALNEGQKAQRRAKGKNFVEDRGPTNGCPETPSEWTGTFLKAEQISVFCQERPYSVVNFRCDKSKSCANLRDVFWGLRQLDTLEN